MTLQARRGWAVAGGVLLVAGVIGFLAVQRLEDADRWASVLSAVVAVTGLAVSVVTMLGRVPETGGQSVTGSTVGGGVRQLRNIGGSVRIGSAPSPQPGPDTSVPAHEPTADVDDAPGAGAGGQSVDRSRVSGPVDQVDQVRGDVEFDR